jgi:hypothetical protein
MLESLARTTKKVESDMERHFKAQINHYETQRRSDTAKIEEMSAALRGLSKTVSLLAANQGHQIQQSQSPQHEIPHREILNVNKRSSTRQPSENQVRMSQPLSQPGLQPQAIPVQAPAPVPVASPIARSPEEIEMGDIVQLINTGHYEQGTIKWLQSNQQADLFDNFFVHISPTYLSRLSAIVMLSVAVAVTTTMQTNIGQRLHWLEVVLQNVNPRDTDLREVAPRILDIMSQRLNTLYMSVVERNPHDPILRLISPLARRARDLHASLS